MRKNLLCLGIATLTLAACSSSPSNMFANEVSSAKDAGQPLVIYQLYLGKYNTVGDGVPVTAGFINTSGHEIATVILQVDAYADGRPVVDDKGQVLSGNVAARGDFAADSSYVATAPQLWAARGGPEASGYVQCPKLTAVSVSFKDGRTLTVEGDRALAYLSPALNAACSREASLYRSTGR